MDSHTCAPRVVPADLAAAIDEGAPPDLASPPDVAMSVDLVPDPACHKDGDCAAPTPRCDTMRGVCVACLPQNDNCPMGQRCVLSNRAWTCVGACQGTPDCQGDGGAMRACCGGGCVEAATDLSNCGACGRACPNVAHTTFACAGGVCRIGACEPGWGACSGNLADGCITNINTDLRNCGGCGKLCGGPNVLHATANCTNGACTVQCDAGYGDCNGNPADGCEVNLTLDPANCGGCKQPCPLVNHQTSECRAGVCVPGLCEAGWANCTGNMMDPCNTFLGDLNHCGSCQTVCAAQLNAMPACVSTGINMWKCGPGACLPGWGDCDKNPANGCEKSVLSDVNNCGACGNVCVQNGDVPACVNGKCGYTMCLQGSADCNMDPTDGCEAYLPLSNKNCGACGNVCQPIPNGLPNCQGGKCLPACMAGFYDCDMNVQNGCEVKEDVNNCGGCNSPCPFGPHETVLCRNSGCQWTCDPGYDACDGLYNKGCNQNLNTDPNNCGKCKVVCAYANAKPACANGVCQLQACNTGYADCDGNPANGCEVNLTNDSKNCGKCGVACQNVNSCVMGACDNRTRVLILASDNVRIGPTVQSGLLATGAFSVVDYLDVSKGTPTLVQLQGYDAVLLWTFQGFLDPQTTGDRLADYWDGGGRVVLALDGYALKGRFGTVANGYRLLQAPFSVDAIMESMAAPFEPQSPLVAGVTRIDAVQAWRAVGGGIVNGGIVVAEWGTTHQPLIVRGVVKGRNRVDLNFYPPSDAGAMLAQVRSWTGDGFVLLKNALLYK